jgi:RPA family protein
VVFNQLKLHVNKYWRTASVAASVAFVASMLTFVGARSIYKKDTHTQYQTLRNEKFLSNAKKDSLDPKVLEQKRLTLKKILGIIDSPKSAEDLELLETLNKPALIFENKLMRRGISNSQMD